VRDRAVSTFFRVNRRTRARPRAVIIAWARTGGMSTLAISPFNSWQSGRWPGPTPGVEPRVISKPS